MVEVAVTLPESRPEDDEDVVWGLSTATALWARGERADAVVWLRRAADAAAAAGQEARAAELGLRAVSIEQALAVAHAAPAAAAPAAPALAAPAAPAIADDPSTGDRPSISYEEIEPEPIPPPPPLPPAAMAHAPASHAPLPLPAMPVLPPIAAPPPIAPPPPSIATPPSVATPPPSLATPPPSLATPPPSLATPPPSLATPPPSLATPPPPSLATPPPSLATPPPSLATPPPSIAAPLAAAPFVAAPPPPVSAVTPPPARPPSVAPAAPAPAPQPARMQEPSSYPGGRKAVGPRVPILDPWADEPTSPSLRLDAALRAVQLEGDEVVVQMRRSSPRALEEEDGVITSAAPLDHTLRRNARPPTPPTRKWTATGEQPPGYIADAGGGVAAKVRPTGPASPAPPLPKIPAAEKPAAPPVEEPPQPPPRPVTMDDEETSRLPDLAEPAKPLVSPVVEPAAVPAVVEAPPVPPSPPPRRPSIPPPAPPSMLRSAATVPSFMLHGQAPAPARSAPLPMSKVAPSSSAPPAAPTIPSFAASQGMHADTLGGPTPPAAPSTIPRPRPVTVHPPGPSRAQTVRLPSVPVRVPVPPSRPPPAPATVVPAPVVPASPPPSRAVLPVASPVRPVVPPPVSMGETPKPPPSPPPPPPVEVAAPPPPPSHLPPMKVAELLPPSPTDVAVPARVMLDAAVLENVEALADVPPEMRVRLAELARVEVLGADDEVSSFGAALLVEGAASVCATIVDERVSRADPGMLVPTRGTFADALALRVVAGPAGARVAVWDQAVIDDALRSCPWVLEELVARADRLQALAGATMGPLGELDEAARDSLLERLAVRVALAQEAITAQGAAAVLVCVGSVEARVAGKPVVVRAGEMLFPRVDAEGAQAGAQGAILLAGDAQAAAAIAASPPRSSRSSRLPGR